MQPWTTANAAAANVQPVWTFPINAAAAVLPFTYTAFPHRYPLIWNVPAQGCAPGFTGWWTTINVGPVWPGDDGAAGVPATP